MLGYGLLLAGLICFWILFSGRAKFVLGALLGQSDEARFYNPPATTG